MKKSKSQVSFLETVQFALRGFKVWWRENPWLLISVLLCGVVEALTPYVDIWLLARLIDEIARGHDPQALIIYVMALMGTSAIFSLLCTGLTRWKNVQLTCLWHIQNKVFIEKLLSMDFADMDDSYVQELRSRIWQNTDSGGWGLYKLIDSFDAIIRSVMSIISAILLTASLFILPVTSGNRVLTILNHPIFILIIIAIIQSRCPSYTSRLQPRKLLSRAFAIIFRECRMPIVLRRLRKLPFRDLLFIIECKNIF